MRTSHQPAERAVDQGQNRAESRKRGWRFDHRVSPRSGSAETVAAHFPWTGTDSPSPGHGGIVIPTAESGSDPIERNWKWVPSGIVTHTPDSTGTIVSRRPGCPLHISPRPARKYQISSTVRWVTALEV